LPQELYKYAQLLLTVLFTVAHLAASIKPAESKRRGCPARVRASQQRRWWRSSDAWGTASKGTNPGFCRDGVGDKAVFINSPASMI